MQCKQIIIRNYYYRTVKKGNAENNTNQNRRTFSDAKPSEPNLLSTRKLIEYLNDFFIEKFNNNELIVSLL